MVWLALLSPLNCATWDTSCNFRQRIGETFRQEAAPISYSVVSTMKIQIVQRLNST